jgi:nucleoside-diphosphate-sugar epimerase
LKRILITGVSGFIGSALFKSFNSKSISDVFGLCRSDSSLSIFNRNEQERIFRIDDSHSELIKTIQNLKPDILIHTATYFHAEHSKEDIPLMVSSVQEYGNLILEGVKDRASKVLFINTGTSWQHFEDSANYRATCLHAAHKEAFEKIIEYYSDAYGLNYTTLKLFDTYGSHDRRKKIVNLLIDSVLRGESLNLTQGKQFLDLVHSKDVANAYLKLIGHYTLGNHIENSYGVSSNSEISVRELANRVKNLINPTYMGFKWGNRLYRNREVFKNWRNGVRIIPGWSPSVGLDRGLTELIEQRKLLLDDQI